MSDVTLRLGITQEWCYPFLQYLFNIVMRHQGKAINYVQKMVPSLEKQKTIIIDNITFYVESSIII